MKVKKRVYNKKAKPSSFAENCVRKIFRLPHMRPAVLFVASTKHPVINATIPLTKDVKSKS